VSPLAGIRRRHDVHASRSPHSTTQSHAAGSHVHRRLARRRRHPHGARQLRSQAPPCRPQPHGSGSTGPPRPKPKPDPDQSHRHMGNTAGREPTSPSSPCRACRRGHDTTPPQSCEKGRRHHHREEGRQPESAPLPYCLPPPVTPPPRRAPPVLLPGGRLRLRPGGGDLRPPHRVRGRQGLTAACADRVSPGRALWQQRGRRRGWGRGPAAGGTRVPPRRRAGARGRS
jgi:hypothetical protein